MFSSLKELISFFGRMFSATAAFFVSLPGLIASFVTGVVTFFYELLSNIVPVVDSVSSFVDGLSSHVQDFFTWISSLPLAPTLLELVDFDFAFSQLSAFAIFVCTFLGVLLGLVVGVLFAVLSAFVVVGLSRLFVRVLSAGFVKV